MRKITICFLLCSVSQSSKLSQLSDDNDDVDDDHEGLSRHDDAEDGE